MMITTLFFALERRVVFEYEESEMDGLVFYGKKGQLTETVRPGSCSLIVEWKII